MSHMPLDAACDALASANSSTLTRSHTASAASMAAQRRRGRGRVVGGCEAWMQSTSAVGQVISESEVAREDARHERKLAAHDLQQQPPQRLVPVALWLED